MAKKLQSKTVKPKSILELEEYYGFKFIYDNRAFSPNRTVRNENSYSLDLQGNVNGLDFARQAIDDITPLNKFNLTYLSITQNNVEDIEILSRHTSLEYAFLGNNKITSIRSLANLKNIKALAYWQNPIRDHILLNCTKVTELYAQKTELEDLSCFNNLVSLKTLVVRDNKIASLEPLLNKNSLEYLDLTNNYINNVPIEIARKYDWLKIHKIEANSKQTNIRKGINLNKNPLQYPPQTVFELGEETVQNYYETASTYGYKPLSEGRIIVIGDGSAGKSSLIDRILYDKFEPGKTQTNGIKIEQLNIQHSTNRALTFHIWDFGGQEVQHAVHKFFFTEGCLYVLVLDNRKEEEPEYWLQQIESLGDKAPVLVVFNKQDDNITELADRKLLKEKYPNIVSFHNVSCKTGYGISLLKSDIETASIKLSTVDELFPNNWFTIKKEIEKCTSGHEHYLDFKRYNEICKNNNVNNANMQKLLLKYFTTIGAVTWFGDTFLNFLHVLSPAWITQGVYKIITSQRTDKLAGKISISDFPTLLKPNSEKDYTYESSHYGYILSMMKKFGLCYSPNDKTILIPSAFGKEPKVEYRDFRGDNVRTYILKFDDYMPVALIHQFIAKNLANAYDNNYWYTGIVLKDSKSDALTMVHYDREAKRIYIRVKGAGPLGIWEHIRREFFDITTEYAKIKYNELISLDDITDSTVSYNDLISYLQASKELYFHPKLKKDYNVGYLLGLFQSQAQTINEINNGLIQFEDDIVNNSNRIQPQTLNIINNISPIINTKIDVPLTINLNIVNNLASEIKGEAYYLIEELGKSNRELQDALLKILEFTEVAQKTNDATEIKESGWSRRLKTLGKIIGSSAEAVKNINEGSESLKNIVTKISALAHQFDLKDVKDIFDSFIP